MSVCVKETAKKEREKRDERVTFNVANNLGLSDEGLYVFESYEVQLRFSHKLC